MQSSVILRLNASRDGLHELHVSSVPGELRASTYFLFFFECIFFYFFLLFSTKSTSFTTSQFSAARTAARAGATAWPRPHSSKTHTCNLLHKFRVKISHLHHMLILFFLINVSTLWNLKCLVTAYMDITVMCLRHQTVFLCSYGSFPSGFITTGWHRRPTQVLTDITVTLATASGGRHFQHPFLIKIDLPTNALI